MLVAYEGGTVILDRDNRNRDSLVSVSEAFRLVASLRFAAEQASKFPINEVYLQRWDCKVESYDGFVALRFTPDDPTVSPQRVPIPWRVANKLADVIEFKAQQARHKMRFEFSSRR